MKTHSSIYLTRQCSVEQNTLSTAIEWGYQGSGVRSIRPLLSTETLKTQLETSWNSGKWSVNKMTHSKWTAFLLAPAPTPQSAARWGVWDDPLAHFPPLSCREQSKPYLPCSNLLGGCLRDWFLFHLTENSDGEICIAGTSGSEKLWEAVGTACESW